MDEGIRFIIMRGPSALCAYMGIPSNHPLAGYNYDDIPVPAHGGLTFAGEGDHYRPEGFYWYGWDYGHVGDYCFYDDDPRWGVIVPGYKLNDVKWLPKAVESDSWETIYHFKQLRNLAEKITNKSKP